MLFRHAMHRMKEEQDKKFYLTATYDQRNVIVACRFGGASYTDQELGLIEALNGNEGQGETGSQINEDLLRSVALIKEMGMVVEASHREGLNEIIIRMAY
jgi:hypothetical protein